MAKPLLLDRPSGTFARFLVPLDLRASVGQRYVVRRLPPTNRDASRLIGACMGTLWGVHLSDCGRTP
jgi:hypothetical protein